MIASRRNFLKFLAAAAAVPTLPAIGEVVKPDLDAHGCWLGLETRTRELKTCGYKDTYAEISGRGYERHLIPSASWNRCLGIKKQLSGRLTMYWEGNAVFVASEPWGNVYGFAMFRYGKPVWRHEFSDGPYNVVMLGDTIRVHEIRVFAEFDPPHTCFSADAAIETLLGKMNRDLLVQ